MKSQLASRLRAATLAAGIHLGVSIAIAFGAGLLVWGVWYPHPFDQLSGGRELFLLIVAVDVVCGPALTMVVFNPRKPRTELIKDLSLIGGLQCAALIYGLWATFEARPLYLVHEVERFRVVAKPDYLGVDVSREIAQLPESMRPGWFSGPVLVGAKPPEDVQTRNAILMEALSGGRDFAQRPEYYLPYDEVYARQAMQRALPLARFIERRPAMTPEVEKILRRASLEMQDALFLPVIHRKDWIAILDARGRPIGFVPGDGFAVR